MEIIRDKIDILTEQIVNLKFLNVEELKTKIRVLFSDITKDLLSEMLSDFDKEYSELYREQLVTNHGFKHQQLQAKLSLVNQKRKQYKKAIKSCENLKEYEYLKQFVKEKYGNDVLSEFFETQF